MQPLLTSEQMRRVDERTIQELGMPQILLMEHAALGIVASLNRRFGRTLSKTRGIILAGRGNNGGDALAAARLLYEQGCQQIFVVLVGASGVSDLSPSTALQLGILGKLEVPWGTSLTEELLNASDWVIDGIFGTGLNREVSKEIQSVIELVNQFSGRRWIVSVDVPSGLSSDSGKALGAAIRASETVTLGFIKRGLVTADGADFVGRLELATIQIPRVLPFAVDTFLYGAEDAARLPFRRPAGHKGDFGHVWVIGGEEDKQGAAILSALGALKAGAGLVTVLGEKEDLEKLRPRLPVEIMTETLSAKFFSEKPKGSVVIGPGFGTERWELLSKALSSKWPLVVDADALTLVAERAGEAKKLLEKRKDSPTVITPHPKEAARLLGTEVKDIEADRFEATRKLSETFQVHALLKGKGTVIRGPHGPTFVVNAGDSGLSKGGTGDLLSGVLAALLGQKLKPEQAVPLAVYLHGRSSELLTQKMGHSRSSLATEIADQLSEAYRELEA